MNVQNITKNVVKYIVSKEDYDLDEYFNNVIFLESKNILTFGDTNYRTFEKFFVEDGYHPEPLDLCLDDDKSIGLEVPNTWYLNKGKHALSIAAYYNYLNFHGVVEANNIDTFNKKIADEYGRIACIEVYLESELKSFLEDHEIEYFGTPRTLTECVRYLEGWSVDEYPRLKGYATFSKFIELWSRIHFPDFNASEWYLGKEQSRRINQDGNMTNVRKAIRFFWEKYLLKEHRYLCPEDVEVDVLGGGKFYKIRQPNVILMSEDLFSKENSDSEIFGNLTKRLSKGKIFISSMKNDFPQKNAEIAKKIYPNAKIALIENHGSVGRNFSLMNPIKQSLNADVVIAAKVLRHMLEQR